MHRIPPQKQNNLLLSLYLLVALGQLQDFLYTTMSSFENSTASATRKMKENYHIFAHRRSSPQCKVRAICNKSDLNQRHMSWTQNGEDKQEQVSMQRRFKRRSGKRVHTTMYSRFNTRFGFSFIYKRYCSTSCFDSSVRCPSRCPN